MDGTTNLNVSPAELCREAQKKRGKGAPQTAGIDALYSIRYSYMRTTALTPFVVRSKYQTRPTFNLASRTSTSSDIHATGLGRRIDRANLRFDLSSALISS
jgi:hypothetical protein